MMFTRLMLTRNLRRALPDLIGTLAANQQSRFGGLEWQNCQPMSNHTDQQSRAHWQNCQQ